mmetsp:Transcript_6488/g.15811  ORF Transcript_6488/g.15811 Transcript_6488/m.15811 type:complete len:1189 (-) Transcript_6488:33-3599(-)
MWLKDIGKDVNQPKLVKHGHWFKNEWPWQCYAQGESPAKSSTDEKGCTMEDKWRLVDLFLQYKGLVTQHIESYNHFINVTMKEIVMAPTNREIRSDADPKWFMRYENIYLKGPSMIDSYSGGQEPVTTTPNQCRISDLTYSALVYVDIVYWKGSKAFRKNGLEIGRIPVMLRSCMCELQGKTEKEMEAMGECPYDPGGYFVVKGTERVLLMQEQPLNNRIIVEYDSQRRVQAFVTSSGMEFKTRLVVCEHQRVGKRGLFVRHSAFTDLIAVSVLLRAMGVQTDMELIQVVGVEPEYVEAMMPSVQECHERGLFTQKAAIKYLEGKLKLLKEGKSWGKNVDAWQVISRQVLSHIPVQDDNLAPKIRYLGLVIRRVIAAQHDPRLIDDRDYYGNKRLELSGQLVQLLFEDQFKTMNSELKKQADLQLSKYHQQPASKKDEQSYPDLLTMGTWSSRSRLTHAMTHAISTGNWNIKRFRIDRAGVSQVLSRFSYMSTVGSMMRVKSNFEKSRKVAGPRALQPSQWGMICPADTPEGEQCGLIKHLALLTHVTTGESEESLRKICFNLGVEDAQALSGEELHSKANYLIFINGTLLGVHRRPKKFMHTLRQLRRFGKVGEFVSIYEHEGWHSIIIASDGGRLCRPLIIVTDQKPAFIPEKHGPLLLKKPEGGGMTFADFLKQGVVEWVDVNEENNLLIALKPEEITSETTHLEVEALTILGVVSGLIPYPNHNQSPRNTYECAMGKQAMGCIAMNWFNRADTLLLGLVYPQKPLATSKTLNLVNFHHLGAGQNASVAVMSYSGYDIEDAIIMNRAALDRGFGRCFVMRRQSVPLTQYENFTRERVIPPPQPETTTTGNTKGASRHHLRKFRAVGEDGLVDVGERVEDECILVHKFTPLDQKSMNISQEEVKYKPTPVMYKQPTPSYIDRVIATQDGEGRNVYKIITRQTRRPELGDKFASRHGQKGVVGLIVPEEDMPFSESGWKPDLIMNPHGFPSRMTVGKMLELIASKAAVMDGIFANCSAFGGTPAEDIYSSLIRQGFSPTGKDYLTSGITGEPLEAYIFSGPIYYQKLKHMVVDKMHARARGPRMVLTRQPTEGRAKEGGLRVGEMERDCLVAYGASNLLLERLLLSSDVTNPTVCRKCGLIAGKPDWCTFCNTGEFVTVVRMPYACKLLFQEMQSMNVVCRLNLVER